MGFTVEDMLLISRDRYNMKLIGGNNGWANSISWLLMVEDMTIIRNFSGKELAVTTCLGFDNEDKLLGLVEKLHENHAAGLILNTGFYLKEVPKKVIDYCNEIDLPLMTVPWEIILSEMIKDLTVRIFLQGETDEQISAAFIKAIEEPENREEYAPDLLSSFDVDGSFQVIRITAENLDSMDSVERKRIGYRLQIYMENISHNAHFFYYNGDFVIMVNAVNEDVLDEIIEGFAARTAIRMPENQIIVGVGSRVEDISNISISYKRAGYATELTKRNLKKVHDEGNASDNKDKVPIIVKFDDMGMNRLLYSVSDRNLLKEISDETLAPVIEYDREHDSDLEETLFNYIRFDGSVQAVSKEMFIHRNTITYRMGRIKQLLDSELVDADEKLRLYIACMIRRM